MNKILKKSHTCNLINRIPLVEDECCLSPVSRLERFLQLYQYDCPKIKTSTIVSIVNWLISFRLYKRFMNRIQIQYQLCTE